MRLCGIVPSAMRDYAFCFSESKTLKEFDDDFKTKETYNKGNEFAKFALSLIRLGLFEVY